MECKNCKYNIELQYIKADKNVKTCKIHGFHESSLLGSQLFISRPT